MRYALAGRILRPISAIIQQSREISEKYLDKRIPLGKTRDELYELSVALNKMFDRSQHSFNCQKEFIGNASHELKTPLTSLKLQIETLKKQNNYHDASVLKNNHQRSALVSGSKSIFIFR